MSENVRVLVFGDVLAKPGRETVARVLPRLRERYAPDFIVGNAENLSGGRGVNHRTLSQMWDMGFHGMTSGNHIWDNKEVFEILPEERRLIRPANYPSSPGNRCPGQGFMRLQSGNKELFVMNVMGRIFMDSLDCPFQLANQILSEEKPDGPVLVDFHAEATSEKYAMAYYLTGRVSAVVGTHTHIQTADEHIIDGKTAFISDLGMTGPFKSVIGMGIPEVVQKFVAKRPSRVQVANENCGFGCVIIDVAPDGTALAIRRIRQTLASFEEVGDSTWPD